MARRTEFGKELIAGQWAGAEFDALGGSGSSGLPVPYPVQLDATEMLMEFIGTARRRRPRPAAGADPARRRTCSPELFEQLRAAMLELAQRGWAHGDLSPYNVLLARASGSSLIDWPQIVDVIGNPRGLRVPRARRHNMCDWFVRTGPRGRRGPAVR